MSKSVDLSGLVNLKNDLEQLRDAAPLAAEKSANEIAARTLSRLADNTPVGDYSKAVSFTTSSGKKVEFDVKNNKQGGTLKKGWTAETAGAAGDVYKVEVINPVKYAPYVEYGHRKVNKDGKTVGWVKGSFMLTKSLDEVDKAVPKLIERNVDAVMKGKFK